MSRETGELHTDSIQLITVNLIHDGEFNPDEFDRRAKQLSPPYNVFHTSSLNFLVISDVLYAFANTTRRENMLSLIVDANGSLQSAGSILISCDVHGNTLSREIFGYSLTLARILPITKSHIYRRKVIAKALGKYFRID